MGCASSAPLEDCFGLQIAQVEVSLSKLVLQFADARGSLVLKPYLSGCLDSICGGHAGPDRSFPLDVNGAHNLPGLFGTGGISLTKDPEERAFPVLREMLQGRTVERIEKPRSTFAPAKSSMCLIYFSATAPGTPAQNPDIRWGPRPDGVGVYREQPMALGFRFRITANQSASTERGVDDYEVTFKAAKN